MLTPKRNYPDWRIIFLLAIKHQRVLKLKPLLCILIYPQIPSMHNPSCSLRPIRSVNLSTSVTSPTLPHRSQAAVSSVMAPLSLPSVQIDPTPKPLSYKPPTLNGPHRAPHRLTISTFSRPPSAERRVTIYPSPSSIQHRPRMPQDSTKAAGLWHFVAHHRTLPLCAFSTSGADSDLLSNSAERCPTLIHTESALCSGAPHGACGCPQRPSYKPSCRCASSRRPMSAVPVTSTKPAWTSHCRAGRSKKRGILPRNRLPWPIISRPW